MLGIVSESNPFGLFDQQEQFIEIYLTDLNNKNNFYKKNQK